MRERDREGVPAIARGREGNREFNHADASDWQVVRRKKTEQAQRSTDVARNYQVYRRDVRRTTYFFTNFPENFRAKHMLKAFLNYGEFEEVVIPPKRDYRGKRYGFARAVNVAEPERFAIILDNIIIGRDKIMVNLPRFERNTQKHPHQNLHNHRKTQPPCKPQPPPPPIQNDPAPLETNHIQKQTKVIQRTVDKPQSKKPLQRSTHQHQKHLHYKPPPKPKKPWAHRHYNVDESNLQKLENAYVGIVEKPGMAYKIQEEFIQQGYFSVRATPMGANMVLLESLEEGEMEALIEGAQEWLDTWFSEIRKWSPGEVDDECLTWIKCYGVPIHAWSEDFFKFLVAGTGEFVILDENTEKKKNYDVARILIRRKRYDAINFVERFEINGELFIIKVVEDWFAPQWYSWNKPKEVLDASSSDTEEESEDSEEFGDGEEDSFVYESNEEEGEANVAGEGEEVENIPVEGKQSGDQQKLIITGYLGETKAAEVFDEAEDSPIPKEPLMMENVGGCVNEIGRIKDNSNPTDSGNGEKANNEGANLVEAMVNNGNVGFNSSPSAHNNSPIEKLKNIEPNPLVTPTLVDPNTMLEPSPIPVSSGPSISLDPIHSSPIPILFCFSPTTESPPSPILTPPSSSGATANFSFSSPNLSLVVELPPLPYLSPLILDDQLTVSRDQDGRASQLALSNSEGENSSNLSVENGRSIWNDVSLSKAEKVWKMAKEIGVTGKGDDEIYVNKIKELEGRDKERCGMKETINGVK